MNESNMETPLSRLKSAKDTGVLRDGHAMAFVRLDDLQKLIAAHDNSRLEEAGSAAAITALKAQVQRLREESTRMFERLRDTTSQIRTIIDQA